MKIEHVAIWVNDLEAMRAFYEKYFNGKSTSKYHNKVKEFESYFLTFESGARLELMRKTGIDKKNQDERLGWAHIAISLGSRVAVDELTAILKNDCCRHLDGPRVTGDGYYESVLEDPEGNLIELTV